MSSDGGVIMAQITVSETGIVRPAPSSLWRVAGALMLAHVVVLFAGFAFETVVDPEASPSQVLTTYGGADLTRVLMAGYVEALSFLVLLVAMAALARLVGTRSEVGRIATLVFVAATVVYVASALAVGFPPGAAALWGAHNGADPVALTMVDHIRDYGYVLQVAVQSAMTAALGLAIAADRSFPRWGKVGLIAGLVGIAVVPFAHDIVSLALMAWWVVLAVLCLKIPRSAQPDGR
jgi:hypothetical protein